MDYGYGLWIKASPLAQLRLQSPTGPGPFGFKVCEGVGFSLTLASGL